MQMVQGEILMRDEKADAAALRNAARVLRERADKQTFALRVVVRTLDRAATMIEEKARARVQDQADPDTTPSRGTSGCVEGR